VITWALHFSILFSGGLHCNFTLAIQSCTLLRVIMSGAYQFLIGKLLSLHGGSATAIKTCNVGCSATSAKAPFCGLCRACGQSLHPVDHLSGLSQQRSGISAWCQTHRLYVRTAATMGGSPAASSRPTDIPTVRDVRNAPAFGPRVKLAHYNTLLYELRFVCVT